MTVSLSRSQTPLSASTTLTPTSPVIPGATDNSKHLPQRRFVVASELIELVSSRPSTSSAVFVYDLAEQAGFGSLTKAWSQSGDETASVTSLQTRAGAGLSLVGRLSQSTSKDAASGSILTAYTSPTGLAGMIPSLVHLPAPSVTSRLVIQVPTVTPVGDRFNLSPSLASLNPALSVLPDSFTVLLSATPQESVDLAVAAYRLPTHVIHLFDHHSSAREFGALTLPPLPSKGDVGQDVSSVLEEAGYSYFEYSGDDSAHTVLVLLNGPLALAAKSLAAQTSGLGILIVRVLRPWDEATFKAALPSFAERIHVLDDLAPGAHHGILQMDALSSLLDPTGAGPTVQTHGLSALRLQELLGKPSSLVQFISDLLLIPVELPPPFSAKESKLLVFSTPGTPLSAVPGRIEQTFATSSSITSRHLTEYDVFSRPGGIAADRILLTPKSSSSAFVPLPVVLPISSHSEGVSTFLAVLDQSLLKSHTVLSHAKNGSIVLVATSWSVAELLSNLHMDTIALLKKRNLRLCTIDAKAAALQFAPTDSHFHNHLQAVLVHLAFLRLYLGPRASQSTVSKVAEGTYSGSFKGVQLAALIERVWSDLVEVDLSFASLESDETHQVEWKDFEFNAIAVSTVDGDTIVNGARLGSWHDAAKHLLFPSAFTPEGAVSKDEQYPQLPDLRPEVPDRTFLVTCTVNRRLTPKEYDRNVFHLEFDTKGTGLKYTIGEALGVHGWNDEEEVLGFCRWYGVDPSRLITIPLPGDVDKAHTRTAFQALQQQIDIYGKPPKSFYTDLAEYASNPTDKFALQFVGSPEGASTFKKLSEKDTVSFADVLQRYPSARPGIEVLCEMVGDIKPRHYSIASAQSVVGDRVDLLVVTVDWLTPSGTPRYGQCTRYLAGLKVGQKVTVSIKPSVMKLPADNMQPLIMAGLGTGAAPFRAFLQHRAMLATQNVPVGPVYYYFGSRHQASEYLYGEEVQAFIEDSVITKAGLAFSRDGPKKVYIQHKMLEDVEDLVRMLYQEKGVFYLCGPTWPVPDVYETLINAFVTHQGLEVTVAADFLEGLKEEERYVLEVY
ncbi:assimilatory sulfite reductase [Artomyces pyxidatus]|uniref:Assimilatory sulfite reductase n=1 Tax=Artomyces pyxidatus TaxID=48021 RepID=A0ACB8TKJ0_9AGAM|nr:assimilatory sulfite reductase [Artomyces pyxidatus]